MVTSVAPPVLLFDGDCAFCSSTARWLEAHIPTPVRLAAWQLTDIDALGVTVDEVDVAVVLVGVDRGHTSGVEAIADLLLTSTARGWRIVGRLLALPPAQALGRPFYRWIARNRHRMPGGTPQCSLPQAERDVTP